MQYIHLQKAGNSAYNQRSAFEFYIHSHWSRDGDRTAKTAGARATSIDEGAFPTKNFLMEIFG
jgi:hypothetical protein